VAGQLAVVGSNLLVSVELAIMAMIFAVVTRLVMSQRDLRGVRKWTR
jgi:hypothetical protein